MRRTVQNDVPEPLFVANANGHTYELCCGTYHWCIRRDGVVISEGSKAPTSIDRGVREFLTLVGHRDDAPAPNHFRNLA